VSASPTTAALVALAVLLGPLPAAAAPGWHQVPFPYPVRSAALESDTSGWAAATVGPNLTGMLRWDGREWTLADTFRNKLVYDIAPAGDSAWAVGEQFNFPDGVVLRWDGAHWAQEDDPFDRTLQAVSFAGPGAGFAGGAAPSRHMPAMLRTAGQWAIDTTLVTDRVILGMAATYPGKCYAVGDSGSIFCRREGEWTRLRTITTQALRRVAMESNTEGWAAGDGGVILRCFKDTWAIAPSPTTRKLYGLSIAGTSGEAWAVGDSGTILHCVRDSWRREPFKPEPPDAPLYTVAFSSGTEGWAFGYTFAGAPVALHYCDDTTGIAAPAMPSPGGAGLAVAPLPGGVGVGFENPAAGPVRLRVFDPSGRLVLERAERLAAGRQEFELGPGPAGVRFAFVEAGGRFAGVKLVSTR
jgi:photosystem II stability/assembly factor-like uncharacterized protein